MIESTTTLPVTGAASNFALVLGLAAMTAGAAIFIGSRKRPTLTGTF
ncbi:MAG: LPXTG cell wall anchor domain-containing protein [Acidimicrobiales bacterium]